MSPGGGAPAVAARGITKVFGDLVAVDDVDLDVPSGQRVMVVGPNGSGKTTFLRIVAGLSEPTDGDLRVLGAEVGSVEARSVTSYIGDNPILYDDLSVREHLEYIGRLYGAGGWLERTEELLERLGLAERGDDLPARFSRGLRQKTAIALALVRPFSLLLVDEPFVGLDSAGRVALLELLEEAADEGRTVVVATHQLDYLQRAQRVVGMRDGRVDYDGPPSGPAVARYVG